MEFPNSSKTKHNHLQTISSHNVDQVQLKKQVQQYRAKIKEYQYINKSLNSVEEELQQRAQQLKQQKLHNRSFSQPVPINKKVKIYDLSKKLQQLKINFENVKGNAQKCTQELNFLHSDKLEMQELIEKQRIRLVSNNETISSLTNYFDSLEEKLFEKQEALEQCKQIELIHEQKSSTLLQQLRELQKCYQQMQESIKENQVEDYTVSYPNKQSTHSSFLSNMLQPFEIPGQIQQKQQKINKNYKLKDLQSKLTSALQQLTNVNNSQQKTLKLYYRQQGKMKKIQHRYYLTQTKLNSVVNLLYSEQQRLNQLKIQQQNITKNLIQQKQVKSNIMQNINNQIDQIVMLKSINNMIKNHLQIISGNMQILKHFISTKNSKKD